MEKSYLDALRYVLDHGVRKDDRTGTGTISVFGMQQRYDLSQGFPAVTTKKLAWRACVGELLWFIEGSGDERRLAEITYGTRDADIRTIWTDNAQADYWLPRAQFPGSVGRVYGVQWRQWRTFSIEHEHQWRDEWGNVWHSPDKIKQGSIDQLRQLISGIKRDPAGRRHILSSWNVADLDDMALPPCHCFAQFYVANGKLSCQMYQRSCDMFLGVPFNIASYSLLTHMIAQVCDLEVGEFVHTLGDAHIYLNHVDQVNEQLSRNPFPAPKLWINPDIRDIEQFTMLDVKLMDYQCHPPIKAVMAI